MQPKFYSWRLLTVAVVAIAGTADISSDLSSHPLACSENVSKPELALQTAAKRSPLLVRQAIALLPFIEDWQVVTLRQASDVSLYLVSWGHSRETASATVEELAHLAEFTIDHHFPIFISAGSLNYRHILASWERGKYPDQAARVLASDIYHEYRHAACGEEEMDALAAQISLLKRWRAEGLLRIADPYIASQESRLRSLDAKSGNKSR